MSQTSPLNPIAQKQAAKDFIARWQEMPCVEEEHSRSFWIELLSDVLGIANPTRVLDFERKVKGRKIDVFYEDMGILVEMKGRGISLDKSSERSKKAGEETPYEQAKWYADNLPLSIRPRWIITCNFDEFRIYDQEKVNQEEYVSFALEELANQIHLLSIFTNKENSRLEREKQLSVQAGALVGKLYAELSQQYKNIEIDEHEQQSLNILIVRLVFLLYAEDSGLLHENDALLNYLRAFSASQTRQAIIDLFAVLDTPENERDPYLPENLLAFPYVNGGLFGNNDIVIPQFTDQIRLDLLLEASRGFNWSNISPTIFGAAFESTLNPQTRRAGGMHYTSIENIHKVIDPLFLDDLKAELAKIEGEKTERNRRFMLKNFQEKLASISVLDPAAGSGNFLTESYLSLRRLENRVIEDLHGAQASMGFDEEHSPIKVSINQFYGIEINDFAVAVAKTALWIAEEQMMEETQEIVQQPFDFLPLKSNSNIHCANALRIDWNEVIPAEKCTYICGNPPFYGYTFQTASQKADLEIVFSNSKTSKKIDYVAGWYKKAIEYIAPSSLCAFVSTNSICQGEQVPDLWRGLIKDGLKIRFAYKPFIWSSEASLLAHVHVVIIGFGKTIASNPTLFNSSEEKCPVDEINPYLIPSQTVFIESRTNPLCNVKHIRKGSQPTDGGNLIIKSLEEYELILNQEPFLKPWIKRFMGSDEFINDRYRWCFWLKECPQETINRSIILRERLTAVSKMRSESSKDATRKYADKPAFFTEDRQPNSSYIMIPSVSSERRKYVPIGFLDSSIIASNLAMTIPIESLFIFGIISSQFHNAWMRVVCGRLESRYRYSNTIVYNNFIWPGVTKENINEPVETLIPAEQRAVIEQCAQAVLDAREAHPGATLADLYDPEKMPADLLTAHKALDAAVEAAYGVDFNGDEEKIVAHLFKLYAEVTSVANK